jgi:CheY-like chemotaxis protein
VEDRSQAQRKHIFAINTSPEFLNIVRELFQEEGYNVTTTNFAPNSFAQFEALKPDALIIDIAIGQEAGWDLLEQLIAADRPGGAGAGAAGIAGVPTGTPVQILIKVVLNYNDLIRSVPGSDLLPQYVPKYVPTDSMPSHSANNCTCRLVRTSTCRRHS